MSAGYRPDIDGLRAVSIVLVVLFHAFPALLPGGYLGVDVFFVISGYLITGLVTRESEHGRLRFPDFYARRVRRLFPALFAVTMACLALGWLALLPEEYALLGKHSLAGALFVPNLALWSEAGYWDTSSELKPLLHLWSLGVEEQFYLMWPGLLLLLRRCGLSLPGWVIPMTLASFVAALVAARTSPEAAFFLPQFRMWELMLGGLLAHYARASAGPAAGAMSAPSALASALSLVGLALIVAAAVVFEGDARHSAWSALMPAAGSMLVIGAGAGGAINRVLLGNRAMVLLGKISYPLYLWHWPLLSFAVIVETGAVPESWKLAALALSVVLAWLTYRFVELPVRAVASARTAAWLLALYLGAGAIGGAVWAAGGFPHRTRDIAARLDAFEWESKGLYTRDDCGLRMPTRCLSNGKPHQVAVVGDSYSTNTFFVLEELYRTSDVGVLRLGKAACLPFYGVERFLGPGSQKCRDAMNASLDHVLHDERIRTVVFSLRATLYLGNAGGNRLVADVADGGAGSDASARAAPRSNAAVFRDALERTIERFVEAGKDVVYVLEWPELDFDPKACVDVRPLRLSRYRERECTIDRGRIRDAAYRAMVLQVLGKYPRTRYWDPSRLLCDERKCHAILDGVMMYRDDHHLSLEGCAYLGRRFVSESPPRDARPLDSANPPG